VPPDRRPWALLAASLTTFMVMLDANIVNVALPAIQRDLGLTTGGVEWVVSGYLLTYAAFMLVGGRLADAFGRRRLLVVGLVVFTGSSLAAGLAGSDDVLLAARAVQGVGAALAGPTALAIISHLYPQPHERARAIGTWSAVSSAALALGPLLGGVLSQHASWGWIFTLNAPVGVLTLGLALWAVPESREAVRRPLDVPGLVLGGTALAALSWALIEGGERGWTDAEVLGAFAGCVVAAAAFVAVEWMSRAPMVDLTLFRVRAFAGGIGAITLWGFGMLGIYFFTSLYLQDELGLSPTGAGLVFLPMAVCLVLGSVLSARLVVLLGAARLVPAAMVVMGLGVGSVSLLGAHAGGLAIEPSFVLIGLGAGLTTPLTSSIVGVLPAAQAGLGSALFNTARQTGGLLGVTVLGVVVQARRSAALHGGATTSAAFLSAYHAAVLAAAALLLVGGVAAWWSLRDATPRSASGTTSGDVVTEAAPVG
jgi:EmrB/QacA subfamily drug resistance transporter